ncbi:hypothetical protein R1T16_08455 [Flavobacterium sp. DG1-102-2]|uniref:hypothetical protein n=1 Tax=Flavobacterium sp. DG1-102-2 TaxID=3081663 RepID=UPI00294A89DA|nr:hypothetical protein [Flavobacterium sp. DG1-102-2]MDV6168457.1 hypothetical protein [Flavobacterium sp. DG1-102-2]
MKFLTLLGILFFATHLYAQDVKGYYLTDSGKKVEGYFDFADFFDTPNLKFKASRSADFGKLPIDITEYGVDEDNLKFEKHTVKIDISGANSASKEPEWLTQTIFLNVLVEGNATLYSYIKDYKTSFFFNTEAKPNEVSQLVYKKYKLEDGTTIENTGFRQQLYNAVKCDGQYASDFTVIKYDKKELTDFFKKYNECKGSKSRLYGPKKKSNFKYTVFAGIHNINLGITYATPAVGDQSSTGYTFGGEAAFTFPSGGPGIFFRAEYETLTSDLKDAYDQGYNVLESNYKISGNALNFVFGPRYNFLLSERSSIAVDAGIDMSIPFADIKRTTVLYPINNGTPYSGDHNEYDLETAFAINLGVGYTFDHYGIAMRYVTGRDYLDDVFSAFKTKHSRLGVVVNYTF